MEPRATIRRNLDTCRRGPPLIQLIGYEQREDAVGVGGAWNVKHTHTHTQSVTRDTQGGWNLGQGSDTISTHVGVAPHQSN